MAPANREPAHQLPAFLSETHKSQTSVASNPTETKILTAKPPNDIRSEEIIPTPAAEVAGTQAKPTDVTTLGCFSAKPLNSVGIEIGLPAGDLPANIAAQCAAELPFAGDTRLECGWNVFEFHWSATCLCHRPLYFEEVNAERYGYTPSLVLQPLISAGHFFLTIPALPYKMVVERPCDCIYTLGHYQPGSCAPRRWNRLPLRAGAALVEVGAIAGLILLIP